MRKVRITYPSGVVYEYESDDPYRIYNAICEHGLFGHCKNEIVKCSARLRLDNARSCSCDNCPVKDWCNVFYGKGKTVYAVFVGVGNDSRAHTSIFERKRDAEELITSYISVLVNRLGDGAKITNDGIYTFVDRGSEHWIFYIREFRLYESSLF